jgi:hypothetical protein
VDKIIREENKRRKTYEFAGYLLDFIKELEEKVHAKNFHISV